MIKKLGFNEYKTNKNHPYRLKLDNEFKSVNYCCSS